MLLRSTNLKRNQATNSNFKYLDKFRDIVKLFIGENLFQSIKDKFRSYSLLSFVLLFHFCFLLRKSIAKIGEVLPK